MPSTSQTTIASEIRLTGVGVHSGGTARISLRPAAPDSGIVFQRIDPASGEEVELVARSGNVVASSLSTVLGGARFGKLATVEHLLAAFGGMGVDNVIVEVEGEEVPIMDGSAADFAEAIAAAGLRTQAANRRYIRIVKPVRIEDGAASVELLPFDGRRIEVEIDFDSTVIGRQAYIFDMERGDFRGELSSARTFGFMRDVEGLRAKGFALGASLDNTVVVGESDVVNADGLRFSDEFVRHKTLDAVGDLMLAGAPILGRFRSVRGGHRLNCAVVDALMADRSAWAWTVIADRRAATRADLGAMMPAAAFRPDVS